MALTFERVRSGITGPLGSIRTPFNRDGSIDWVGVRRMIDFEIENGCPCTLLTAGDSHFHCMTDEEIREINRVAIEHTAGRALVIACDWEYCTPQAVAHAKYCRDLGADIIMARPADWGPSCTVNTLVEHYARVAEIMPVMLVTNIFSARSMKFGMDTIQALMDKVPGVMAVKDDMINDFARQMCMLVKGKWAVMAGGGQRNHLNMLPYGVDGFMDRFMSFKPSVSKQYWAAIQRNDMDAAVAVIRDIELPLEIYMDAVEGSRDAAIHGLFEIYGIAGRWRRPPYYNLNDKQMAELKAVYKDKGLL